MLTEEEKKQLEQLQEKAKKKPKKKKGRFMKLTIIILFTFLFFFVVSNMYIFYKTGSEPSTLIASVFALCVGEFSILGFIKSKKGGGSDGI